MGSMSCHRNGCENTGCRRCASRYGYLCEECYQELLQKPMIDIQDFMDSKKGPSIVKAMLDAWEVSMNNLFSES
jgi:hypothetical protein